MFDFKEFADAADFSDAALSENRASTGPSPVFLIFKRGFDLAIGGLVLLPIMLTCGLLLLVLNPFFNRGPLFFAQVRMGRGCKPFVAYKFRSMAPADRVTRRADDPLETARITPLGNFIRKTRIDELPQILNVLIGDMSLIGPRPDYIHHARRYLRDVPGYRGRHLVKPGISGLAQTEVGYVEGTSAVLRKVRADHAYIRNQSFALDMWIFWRTLVTVFGRRGS